MEGIKEQVVPAYGQGLGQSQIMVWYPVVPGDREQWGAKVEPDLKVIKMLDSRITPWRGVDEELWTAVCP